MMISMCTCALESLDFAVLESDSHCGHIMHRQADLANERDSIEVSQSTNHHSKLPRKGAPPTRRDNWRSRSLVWPGRNVTQLDWC